MFYSFLGASWKLFGAPVGSLINGINYYLLSPKEATKQCRAEILTFKGVTNNSHVQQALYKLRFNHNLICILGLYFIIKMFYKDIKVSGKYYVCVFGVLTLLQHPLRKT